MLLAWTVYCPLPNSDSTARNIVAWLDDRDAVGSWMLPFYYRYKVLHRAKSSLICNGKGVRMYKKELIQLKTFSIFLLSLDFLIVIGVL